MNTCTLFTIQIALVIAVSISYYLYANDVPSSFTSSNKIRLKRHRSSITSTSYNDTNTDDSYINNEATAVGGSWHYVNDESVHLPYNFSQAMCNNSFIMEGDCIKAKLCNANLMNWEYLDKNKKPYPKFEVTKFREVTRDKSIVFVGSSMMRQQVQALVWSMGHEQIEWNRQASPIANCTSAERTCFTDTQDNITICHQFMGSFADPSKTYHEGNYSLNHTLRGHGDSSCLLRDEMITNLSQFDYAFVQEVAWWTSLNKVLDSPTSPSDWISTIISTVYYDAMNSFLSRLSKQTRTIFVLGQIGVRCRNKTMPEPFVEADIANDYGWNVAPKLWNASLELIRKERLDVQIVDARDPLMQSVHAHPWRAQPTPDCLHFCMNSAAINIYLDIYWNEVFSR